VYFNGTTREAKRLAASRNLPFHSDYFVNRIIGNAQKAETHRFCHETSEDALTWNVFSELEYTESLGDVVRWMLPKMLPDPPSHVELYLWGIRVSVRKPLVGEPLRALVCAREVFEKGIFHYHTEPDIILHVPGRVLLLIEAKFTSGNTIARATGDLPGHKPNTRAGLENRYSSSLLPPGALLGSPAGGPFFSQLYRNLIFAVHMAGQLQTAWAFGNLTSQLQVNLRSRRRAYKDPKSFVLPMLPAEMHGQFVQPTWEGLESAVIRPRSVLRPLSEYLMYKSAHCRRALAIPDAV
jgi:hypothetical protein